MSKITEESNPDFELELLTEVPQLRNKLSFFSKRFDLKKAEPSNA